MWAGVESVCESERNFFLLDRHTKIIIGLFCKEMWNLELENEPANKMTFDFAHHQI